MIKIIEKISNISDYNPGLSDLYRKITELEAQILKLQQQQQDFLSARTIIIEKLYVRRVAVEEVQFKLDKISVDDLSGMLNVGVNSEGKMEKKEKKK